MKSLGQLLLGLITAAASSLLVLSAVSLALVEGGVRTATQPTQIEAQPSPTVPGLTLTVLPPQSVTLVATQVQPTDCPTPEGWKPYTIQPGDTLESIAVKAGITAEQIQEANCLSGTGLIPNTVLYLPVVEPTPTAPTALPTALPTQTPPPTLASTLCGPPPGWVVYYVRPGDTLFRLSLDLGISMFQLQSANCMTGTQINAGQRLWVPFIPAPRQPIATNTPTLAPPTATDIVEPTVEVPTVVFPTATDTQSPTATTAPTNTVAPSATPVTPSPTQETPAAQATATTGSIEIPTEPPQTETTPSQ